MCGIAGIFDARIALKDYATILGRMGDAIVHRGPDQQGVRVLPEVPAGLRSCRLSLVDLARGGQPMANEDDTVHLVFNGEIYNHRQLRHELQAKGHTFRSECDTEVVVHLYEDHGIDCLARLHGMFALAIVDTRKRRLLLARDSIGMRCVYWTHTPAGLLFGSEIRAIVASGLYERRPDAVAVRTFLHASYVPSPLTGFDGVRKLPPAGWLTVEDGKVREGRFWLPRFRSDGPSRTEGEQADRLRQLLESATTSHIDADVPVGVFISGGLDSSTIALLAAELRPRKLKSYSIVFPEDPGADESRFSRLIAGRIGSDHREIEFRLDDLREMLATVARAVEEPSLRSPWVLDHLLAKHASADVKAVLTGEGADELFGGYPWLRNRPYSLGESFNGFFPRPLAGYLATRLRDYRARRLFRALAAPGRRALDLEWYHHLSPPVGYDCLSPDLTSIEPNLDLLLPAQETMASCRDRLQRRLAIELWGRLPDGILLPSDKVSMAHSLEVRMPFLDHSIVEYALALPSQFKIKKQSEKHVLKLASGAPQEIVKRQKFGLRYGAAMDPVLARMAQDILLDARDLCPYIHRDAVESALAADRVSRLMLLHPVMLQCWWSECIKGAAFAGSRRS